MNLDTNIKANTQVAERFPQVYLKAFYHEQNLTKYSKLKFSLFSALKLCRSGSFCRLVMGEGAALVPNAAFGNSPDLGKFPHQLGPCL